MPIISSLLTTEPIGHIPSFDVSPSTTNPLNAHHGVNNFSNALVIDPKPNDPIDTKIFYSTELIILASISPYLFQLPRGHSIPRWI